MDRRHASAAGVVMKWKPGEHRLPDRGVTQISFLNFQEADGLCTLHCVRQLSPGVRSPCISVQGEHKTKGEIQ